MDAIVGVRCSPSISTPALPGILWNRTRTGVSCRLRRVCSPPAATLEDQADGVDGSQVQEVAYSTDNVMKLFNVTQHNLLYLNKERLNALDELDQVRRDNDLLSAKLAQLNAEYEVSVGDCDLLQRKLSLATGGLWTPATQVGLSTRLSQKIRHLDPFSIWSELLLRIDALALTGAMTLGQASALRNLVRKRDAQTADVYVNSFAKDDKELSSRLLALLAPDRRGSVHVVHICTEIAPLVQAGSLATYISKLCLALRKKGHLVEVIIPKYASIDLGLLDNVEEISSTLFSYFGGEWHENKIWTGVLNGVAVTLIDSKHPSGFFERENLYDYEDDFERFTYFSRASLEYILKSGKQPNVLHIHNWQTAVVAPLFWEIYANLGLQNTRIVFTCHDFRIQSLQEPYKVSLCGLDPQQVHRPDRLQDNVQTELVNVLKGGIIYSNRVTTASPLHAQDILTKEHGHGLDSTSIHQQYKLNGILNGVDDSIWDPSNDPLISSTYSIEDLSGKAECKSALRKSLKLPLVEKSKPLIGCIAPNITAEDLGPLKIALGTAVSKGAQFVFIGGSKDPQIQEVLVDLQQENKNGHFSTSFSHFLAHQVVAASDILVCPCFFEPADQWQLIAMAYGTVPVAREINGIQGSIVDADDAMRGNSYGTGFTFVTTQSSDLASTLNRALHQLENDPERWNQLIQNGMMSNHTWDGKCVEAYESVYYLACGS